MTGPERIATLIELVPRLAGRQVLVIGDLILDEYLTGTATRMSREAPIPVLEFEARRLIPGGAANPAANIAALGSRTFQIGVVGADEPGQQLTELLAARGIDTGGLIIDPQMTTTVKTRIMAQMGLRFPQQVARLDRVARRTPNGELQARIVEHIQGRIDSVAAVLFSDYHVGLITPGLIEAVRGAAGDALLTADAQGELIKYTGFDLVKCNADEARQHLRRELTSHDDFAQAAAELVRELRLRGAMVITRGAAGATLATADGPTAHCPAPAVSDVYDTVGAGDTAIAVLTLAVIAGASYAEAAALANYASGLVVRRVGNHAPTPDELIHALKTWS
jgi:D-glycero-beta-D-manno-heptose-7-phosphate kinase